MFRLLIIALGVVTALAPRPAEAGWCEELWFTRNAILDRAGVCFGTPLGQAVFDNTGCTGRSVNLPPEYTAFINQINQEEQRVGCRVNTSSTFLDLDDLGIRQRLVGLPVPYPDNRGQGFGCIGWQGPATNLLDNHDPKGQVIGRIDPGDNVYFMHATVGDWSYVTTSPRGGSGLKSGGWMPKYQGGRLPCEQEAG